MLKNRFYILAAIALAGCKAVGSEYPSLEITSIYWSDGDSGYLNGKKIPFRLANVDAPETGGVGAAIGGAKCELERQRGFEAKAFVVELTENAELTIHREYGLDKYKRLVINLHANGLDVGKSAVNTGHLQDWPHKGRRQLVKKPDWCKNEGQLSLD